jgi:hypothetical protein
MMMRRLTSYLASVRLFLLDTGYCRLWSIDQTWTNNLVRMVPPAEGGD